jgi:hypothetical protein
MPGGAGVRRKGHNFERAIAIILSEALGVQFRRGLHQTRSGGAETSDVVSPDIPRLHIECKKGKRTNIKGALFQAHEDIKASKENRIPVVVTQDDRDDVLVTMRLKDWLKLAQKMTLEDWAALNYKD